MSPSALLREEMARTRRCTRLARAVQSEDIRQVTRIGHNLNQFAR